MRKTIQRPDRRQRPSFNREGPSAPHPLWPKTTVTGSGYLRFRYKRSCEYGDEFTLFIDGSYRLGQNGAIDGDWIESGAWYITGSGTHTIRWRYSKNGSGSAGEDCVWVDYVRWSGTMPDAGAWGQIEYVYDPAGRRIEKKVDGTTELKFLYDGDLIIAEYDANDTLLRKYVHGPCIDEPICLIETTGDYAGTQYYHYDALGSVVALTDPNGDVVQLYEYSVYGQVAASDANHPNRFMFTGREFDKDTGLYYYRARYYHPEIGRFLQTDPARQGVNCYAYCQNHPITLVDPSGCIFDYPWIPGLPPFEIYDDTAEGRWVATINACDLVWQYIHGNGGRLIIGDPGFSNPHNEILRVQVELHFRELLERCYESAVAYFEATGENWIEYGVSNRFGVTFGEEGRFGLHEAVINGWFELYLIRYATFLYKGVVHCSRTPNPDPNTYEYNVQCYIKMWITDIGDLHPLRGWPAVRDRPGNPLGYLELFGYLFTDGVLPLLLELAAGHPGQAYPIKITNASYDGYGPMLRRGSTTQPNGFDIIWW